VRFVAALAFTSTFGLWTVTAQSNSNTESNIECVERLQMPIYPKLADAARISGRLTAAVKLSKNGAIQNTVLQMGSASVTARSLLAPAVDEALRASVFSKSCEGRSVILVFDFVLSEEFDSHHLPQTISYGYPNRFWISVPAKVVNP
jgi:hypothetical protein